MILPGGDHDRQTAEPPTGGEETPKEPLTSGSARWIPRAEAVIATAKEMVNSTEQFVLSFSVLSDARNNTALAAVIAARTVLNLAHTVLRILGRKQH